MTGHSLNVLKLSTASGSFLAIEVSTRVIYQQAVLMIRGPYLTRQLSNALTNILPHFVHMRPFVSLGHDYSSNYIG